MKKTAFEENNLFIPNEVIAEIVHVLEKVYLVDKKQNNKILSE